MIFCSYEVVLHYLTNKANTTYWIALSYSFVLNLEQGGRNPSPLYSSRPRRSRRSCVTYISKVFQNHLKFNVSLSQKFSRVLFLSLTLCSLNDVTEGITQESPMAMHGWFLKKFPVWCELTDEKEG